MHSRHLIVIYLQNSNAEFHQVVRRHCSGEAGNVYTCL